MNVRELEDNIWIAAKNRDSEAFLNYVSREAVMVCGGYRCTGAEYATFIQDFDLKTYDILHFETVVDTEDVVQVHYVIKTEVYKKENNDLEGVFHVTSTWKKTSDDWKLVFNMDSRILENI